MPIMQVNGNMQSLNSSQKPAAKAMENKGGFSDILGSTMKSVSQDTQDIKSNNGENAKQDANTSELKDVQRLLLSLEQLLGQRKEKEVPGSALDANQLMMDLQQLYQMIQTSTAVPVQTTSNQAAGSVALVQLLANTPQQTANLLEQNLAKLIAVMQAQGKDGLNSDLNSEIAQVVKGLSDLLKGTNTDNSLTLNIDSYTGDNESHLALSTSVGEGARTNHGGVNAGRFELEKKRPDLPLHKSADDTAGHMTSDAMVNPAKRAAGQQTDQINGGPNQTNQLSGASELNSDMGLPVDGKQSTQVTDSVDTQKVVFQQLQNPLLADKHGVQLKKAALPLVPSRFFVKEMEVVITNQMKINNGTGAYETTLRLFPENLGRVDVKISALNGQITAQFLTTSAAGKDVVERQLDQLKNTLVSQGLEVSKLEVVQNSATPSDSSNSQSNGNLGDQQKNQSQSQQQESDNRDEQPGKNFFDDLINATDEGEQPDHPIELNGVNVTA